MGELENAMIIVSSVGLAGLLSLRLALGMFKDDNGNHTFKKETIETICKWYFMVLCFIVATIGLIGVNYNLK